MHILTTEFEMMKIHFAPQSIELLYVVFVI